MKYAIPYFFVFILLQACQTTDNKIDNNTQQYEFESDTIEVEQQETLVDNFDIELHLKKYQNLKTRIRNYRNTLKARENINNGRKRLVAKNYMNEMLVDSIFSYWIGTKWDFNGYTEKPREGVVACGYFVSTTLRDLGIKLNRFKIAQKAASDIINALCDSASIVKVSTLNQVNEYLKEVNHNETLIVGLDNHVGFIFRRDNKNYFAHSNYIDRKGVEIELLESSIAFKSSNIYVIGNLTRNEEITRNWLD